MGVYIKGMEMPTTCEDCRLSTFTGFDSMPFCNITMDDICLNDWETKRCDNCPLVPVPTPHGRLGDLDEINEKHDKLSRDFCHGYFKSTWDFVCAARKIFYDAPTIIPAEEGET